MRDTQTHKWKLEELRLLRTLADAGLSAVDIGTVLGRTRQGVTKRANLEGIYFSKIEGGPLRDLGGPIPSHVLANVLHLLDLKRAGHSARQTELKIAPGYTDRVMMPRTDGSYCGSQAAMCMGF